MKNLFVLLGIATSVFSISADRFWDTFGSGKAELSSYRVKQPRYGEVRNAESVLIFVPEDLNQITRVKVENYDKTPPTNRIPVLKLNRVLYFNTGVYHYHIMTSVFSAISWPEAPYPFFPAKLSLSVSEWCGNFYEQLLPSKRSLKREMHSYFESEGDRQETLAMPEGGIFEDDLPILIRELQGEWMKSGETKNASVYPSLWEGRMTHELGSFSESEIKKAEEGKLLRWDWNLGKRRVTYWVEKSYPHYITKWKDSAGGSGERIRTLHLPYWQHHQNIDEPLRKKLGLR